MMKLNQKRGGVILSYLSTLLNILIQLIYTPIMLRILGQSEYGLYTLANSTISYLSLFDFGFSGAYLKFYAKYKTQDNEKEVNRLNGTFLKIFTVLSIIALLSGFCIAFNIDLFLSGSLSSEELVKSEKLMLILSISLGLTLFSTVWDSIIMARECFITHRVLRLVKIVFSPFIALPLMLIGFGSMAIAISSVVVSFITLIFSIYYCLRKLFIKVELKKSDKKFFVEVGKFSFFIFLNEIISQINWNIDKVLLGYFCGTSVTAIYGVGSQIDIIYRSMSSSISSVLAPKVNRLVAEGAEDKKLTDIFIKVGRIQFVILCPILLGFITFGKYFIKFWAGDGYQEAYWVALLLMVSVTVPLIQNVGIDIQQAKNKHQFRSIVYFIIAIGNVFLSIPLCKYWGAVGSAFGTAVTLFLGNGLIMNWFYHRHIGIDIKKFWKEIINLFKALLLPIVYCILIIVLKRQFSIVSFSMTLLFLIVIYLLSIWKWGLNESEKGIVRDVLKKFSHK